MVEPVLDLSESRAVERRKVTRRGQVLADETVGVLGGAALPRGIGVREVEVGIKVGGDVAVCGEFPAFVGSYRFHGIGKGDASIAWRRRGPPGPLRGTVWRAG
jgi:hypothetical protein